MESATWPTVCLDFARREMIIVPILSFVSSLVKGLSGMGEALVYGSGWQLFALAGYREMDDLGLLAGLICVMQCASTALLAMQNGREWWWYAKPGAIFSVAMLLLSPVGNHVREVAPTDTIQLVLALTFLTFALAKVAFDGLVALWRAKGGGAYSDPPQAHGAVCTKGATTPPAVEEAPETDVPEKSEKRLPPAPSWLLRALPGVGLVGGFLGGLCGMNGPPFILLTAITGLDKVIARNVFPMGQAVEVWTFRLPMLLVLGRIQLVDAHLYVVSFLAGSLGLWAGNALAPYVSQRWFERALLLFLVLSSLSVLGIFEGRPASIAALAASAMVSGARLLCAWHHGRKART